ncbi:MAG: hypothetical protein P4L42_00215 [Desulfocapsaceae bacterium]|nr:hypothetical protein [Desulfocapsaceae bacterium]
MTQCPLPKSGSSEVYVEVITTISVAGSIGDGSKVNKMSIGISGNPYDLLHLKRQFSTGQFVLDHNEDYEWFLQTTRYNGRTDWVRIYDEFQGIVVVLSGLLKLLRRARQPLLPGTINWHDSDGNYGPIFPQPVGMKTVVANEHTITYNEQKQ